MSHSSLELLATLGARDDRPARRHSHAGMVFSDMTGASSEFKVLKPVVVLDFIDVVHVLVGSERAPKMALHDDTMFQQVDAVACELNVAVFANSSSDVPVAALTRAETHHASGSA